ncbi:hypothetical protein AB0G24_20680, partial [Streptomyces xinghaiensis]
HAGRVAQLSEPTTDELTLLYPEAPHRPGRPGSPGAGAAHGGSAPGAGCLRPGSSAPCRRPRRRPDPGRARTGSLR